MATLTVQIDTTSPRSRDQMHRGGNILVDCQLVVDQRAFPSAPFLDFPVVVLGWWLAELEQLRTDSTKAEGTFSFMNGPFEWVATRHGADLALRFVRRTLSAPVDELPSTRIPISTLGEALLTAVVGLLVALDQAGASGPDIDLLRGHRDAVQRPATEDPARATN